MIYVQPVSVKSWNRTFSAFNDGCQSKSFSESPDVVKTVEQRISSGADGSGGRVAYGTPDFSSPLSRSAVLTDHQFGFGGNIGKPLAILPHGIEPPPLRPPLRLKFTPPKRPKGAFAAFKLAKKEGRIVVNDRLIWKSEIIDFVIPDTTEGWGTDVYSMCNEDPLAVMPGQYCFGRNEGSMVYPGWYTQLPANGEQTAYSTSMNYRFVGNSSPTTLLTQYPNIGIEVANLVRYLNDYPMDTELVTSANAEFRSDIYDLLTELGELPETVSFIYGGIKAILTSYIDVKRRIRKLKRDKSIPAKEVLDRIASLWMGYRYGIMPIVYSVHDAMDLLASRSNMFITHRSGKNIELTPSPSDSNSWNAAPFTVRDRVWIKGSVDPTIAMRGFKLNLASTAWELVPLSFVIDWALNIGDLLSSLSTPAGLQQQASSYSRSFKGTIVLTNQYGIRVPVRIEFYQLRSINPTDHIGLAFNPNLTWKRSLDALALAWFAFKAIFLKGK